jgi:hypothetical protein
MNDKDRVDVVRHHNPFVQLDILEMRGQVRQATRGDLA